MDNKKIRKARKLERKPACGYMAHESDADLWKLWKMVVDGKTPWCYPPFCIRKELELRKQKVEVKELGIFEKNLIIIVVRYFLRWLMSNDRNHQESEN